MLRPRSTNTVLFSLGLFLTLTIFGVGLLPAPVTYLHFWQVELPAAVFLGVCCIYIIVRPPNEIELSPAEFRFVVLPMLALIVWSAVSALWAPYWKPAVHHALLWALYLIFYLIVRRLIGKENGLRNIGLAVIAYLTIYSIVAVSGYISLLIFNSQNPLGRLAKQGEQIVTILPLLLVTLIGLKGRAFWIGTTVITLFWLLIFCTSGRINLFLFGAAFVTAAVVIAVRTGSGSDWVQGTSESPSHAVLEVIPTRSALKKLAIIAAAIIISPAVVQMFSLLSETPTAAPVAVQRLSDDASLGSSNNFRRLMNSVSKQMVLAHPVLGIGADNFGFQVNEYRKIHAAKYPDDVSLREAEDNLPERAHNEFLQIGAELGIVGVAITLWLAAGLIWLLYRAILKLARKEDTTPVLLSAAVIGLGAFCVSSLVSSYSFRLIQNGFVFFLVLAVAWRQLSHSASPRLPYSRLLPAAGLLACLLMIAYWTPRIASTVYTNRANYTADIAEAERLYANAERLDDDNPNARYFHGMRLFGEGRYSEAAPLMTEAIRMGRARSVDFSHLASAYTLAGDNTAAENTMAQAFKLYPQSVFVLTRYAHLLSVNGKPVESEAMLARARSLNPRDANAWWTLLTEGGDPAADKAIRDAANYTPLMDLQPLSAVYAVRDEIFIRHPEQNKLDSFK